MKKALSMGKRDFLKLAGIFFWGVLGGGVLFGLFEMTQLSMATELPQERDLYNTIPGSNQKDTILDATSPMDLMNRLRRATAMDDATTPSDAIDEALKALEDINTSISLPPERISK